MSPDSSAGTASYFRNNGPRFEPRAGHLVVWLDPFGSALSKERCSSCDHTAQRITPVFPNFISLSRCTLLKENPSVPEFHFPLQVYTAQPSIPEFHFSLRVYTAQRQTQVFPNFISLSRCTLLNQVFPNFISLSGCTLLKDKPKCSRISFPSPGVHGSNNNPSIPEFHYLSRCTLLKE